MKPLRLLLGKSLRVLVAAGLLAPTIALADDDLDVTMRMVTDDVELTDSVVREIALPPELQRPEASRGSEPRDKGQAFGESMSEKARQSRELIEGRPEAPERPELPDRPERPDLPDAPGRDR